MRRITPLLFFVLSLSAGSSVASNDAQQVVIKPLQSLLSKSEASIPAEVVSLNHSTLSAQTTGQITELSALVGDAVSKDQILALIDCRLQKARLSAAKAGLNQTQAQLAFADQQLKRAKNLKTKKSISDEILDQRKMELRQAQANNASQRQSIIQAEVDVEYCEVKAPFDGHITARPAMLGELATPGMAMFEILQTGSQEVSAKLKQDKLQQVQHASALRFRHQGKDYPVAIRTSLPSLNSKTRSQELRLSFTGKAAMNGASGRLIWTQPNPQISARYGVIRDGQIGIFSVSDKKAVFHPIENAIEGQPLTLPMLLNIEYLVIEGQHVINHGDDVEHP